MKKGFLIGVLVLLALGLCGLCATQWVRETGLRQQVEGLYRDLQRKEGEIKGLGAAIKTSDAEILRLDQRNGELKQALSSNQLQVVTLRKEMRRTETENERLSVQSEEYKKSVLRQNDAIRKQNEDVREMNALLKKVAAERDDFVMKFNASVKDYNELVMQHNGLVKKADQLQVDLAKALNGETKAAK